jgi:hypothetical protein
VKLLQNECRLNTNILTKLSSIFSVGTGAISSHRQAVTSFEVDFLFCSFARGQDTVFLVLAYRSSY